MALQRKCQFLIRTLQNIVLCTTICKLSLGLTVLRLDPVSQECLGSEVAGVKVFVPGQIVKVLDDFERKYVGGLGRVVEPGPPVIVDVNFAGEEVRRPYMPEQLGDPD